MVLRSLLLILLIHQAVCLIPPKFQWKTIDFAWESQDARKAAIENNHYIPENCMPTGLVRWRNKLFITIPRWKKGIPSSLNYIYMNGTQQDEPLKPYPTWKESFVAHEHCCVAYNSTVVSASRMFVDAADRLWVVDNGVSDVANIMKQITRPAILIFDLHSDTLMRRYELGKEVIRDSSALSSIVVDITRGQQKPKNSTNTYAYITDQGSNAIIVYSLNDNTAWRVENHSFGSDRFANEFNIGGVQFNSTDGISGAALGMTKKDGDRDLYFSPTSSNKQFRISTRLLKNKTVSNEDLFNNVEVIGDRGPGSQASACDFDPQNNIYFYNQLNKNGVGCWNVEKPFNNENSQVIMSDCFLLEFPDDIKVDREGNLWILSNRRARFLNGTMDFAKVNFRVLTTPITHFVKGTPCQKLTTMQKACKCCIPKLKSTKKDKAKEIS